MTYERFVHRSSTSAEVSKPGLLHGQCIHKDIRSKVLK